MRLKFRAIHWPKGSGARVTIFIIALSIALGKWVTGTQTAQGAAPSGQKVSAVTVKEVPDSPIMSAVSAYLTESQPQVTSSLRTVVLPSMEAVYLLFWTGKDKFLVSSYYGNDIFSFDGFRFREVSIAGKVTERKSFVNYVNGPKVSEIVYPQVFGKSLRLWMWSGTGLPGVAPIGVLKVKDGHIAWEYSQKQLRESNIQKTFTPGQLLRPFGRSTKNCSNTSGESSPITINDTFGTEFGRFNLPSAVSKGKELYRIVPSVQSLVVDTGREYVGLLNVVESVQPCFSERPPMDLLVFSSPKLNRQADTIPAKTISRKVNGEGKLLNELRRRWKVTGWTAGSIEWAELLNDKGAVIFRRDSRVEQDLWCSEICLQDQFGKESLIDYMILVSADGLVKRYTAGADGAFSQVAHRGTYWGVGYSMIPSLSPDKRRISYAKWDKICIADIPKF